MVSLTASKKLDALLEHRGFVRQLARQLTAAGPEVDDLEQETWLAALQGGPRGDSRRWLRAVVRNASKQLARREGRRRAREAQQRPARSENAATDQVVARAEVAHLLVERVLALSEPYRTTILLRFFEGLAPREVARRLNLPVETVRTRQKRALAELRSGLERDQGTDWRRLILPLAASSPGLGAKLGVAVVLIGLLGVAGGAMGLFSGSEERTPPKEGSELGLTRSLASSESEVLDTDSKAVPPIIIRPRGGEESPGVAVLPVPRGEADPSVPAGLSSLTLSIAVEPFRVESGERCSLISRFHNDGPGAVEFFQPFFAGRVPFPKWQLRDGEGRVFIPAAAPFQTVVGSGIQGSIIALGSGETHEIVFHTASFYLLDVATGKRSKTVSSLPVGIYEASASYEWAKAEVPWYDNQKGDGVRPRPGLWTGKLKSNQLTVVVDPSERTRVTLKTLPPEGDPAALPTTLKVIAGARTTIREQGHWRLRTVIKARGSSTVDLPAEAIDLAPGEVYDKTVDLSLLSWTSNQLRGQSSPAFHGALRDLVSESRVRIEAKWISTIARGETEEIQPLVAGCVVPLGSLPDAEKSGLHLQAELLRGGASWPTLRLVLSNTGSKTLRLPRSMAWPRILRLTLLRLPDPGRDLHPLPHFSNFPSTLSLRGPAEEVAAPTVDDFLPLSPGASFSRDFALADRVRGTPKPGRYEIRIQWRSGDDGRRLGFTGAQRAFIGRIVLAPLRFTMD